MASASLAIALIAAAPAAGGAQPIAASALKAAFMLNFVKFAEWPTRPPKLPIRLCVSGDEAIAAALTRTAARQSVDGRTLSVTRLAAGDAVQECQLLFLGDHDPRRRAALLLAAGQSPVLTVSDVERSATAGVMIELFLEKDRLRFAINLDAVERAQTKLSSRILALAVIVRDKVFP